MMKSFPLGIDIGSTRLRMVHVVLTIGGPRIRAVVTREVSSGICSSGLIKDSEYIGTLLDEAREELQTKERRCVIAVGEPDAVLRIVEFPKMTELERGRAANFEAQRYVEYSIDDASVRIHPVDERRQIYALGIVRLGTIRSRLDAVKSAGLLPVAADHEALALARALPGYDAILDIGHERTSVHITSAHAPLTLQHPGGGADITRGIERELSINASTAEKRKRIVGTAGAGEHDRRLFLADVTSLLESAGATTDRLRRIALVGNGARLNAFSVELERATGLLVEMPASDVLLGDAYPADVVRAGAPDWNLAAGLAIWGRVAA